MSESTFLIELMQGVAVTLFIALTAYMAYLCGRLSIYEKQSKEMVDEIERLAPDLMKQLKECKEEMEKKK